MHEDVINEIIANNEWRFKDFTKFKINQNNVEQILWNRMCIPMIYAHWEGYVIDALKIMLQYLNKLELKHNLMPINLVVLCLGENYKSLSGKQTFSQRIEFTNKFYNLLNNSMCFSTRIETKSNLKSNVFKEICEKFDFETAKYDKYLVEIDSLVNVRNRIAHGENACKVSSDNLNNYIISIYNLTDLLLVDIKEFLEKKKYLK
ncbi:MAE_28990/MAE_18760 family HEPN-like nuclease [Gilliamella apis]|uniref:MAE_28990/MAE_18760 family HEPN-like nuclease n=1 Tax=Gilliamella apis TaxID=1970738 RepID=UPI001FD5F5F3|nr:MAE_28990/MAE_18760 family HEPN-like nuclease [Gilliamella apis]